MAVLEPLKVIIDNYPEDKTEQLDVELHPDHPEMGSRNVTFSKELYIEKSDFMIDPPKKYFRLFPGNEVRFKSAYFVKCVGYDTDSDGNVTCVHCTYDPESRGGNSPDGRKVKGTIHFVSASDCRKITVNLYDRLFNVENPGEDDGRTLEEKLNPNSLTVLDSCLIEGVVESKPGSVFQFMRQGYFCEDKDSTSENPVFNRTVQLNSSWDKK